MNVNFQNWNNGSFQDYLSLLVNVRDQLSASMDNSLLAIDQLTNLIDPMNTSRILNDDISVVDTQGNTYVFSQAGNTIHIKLYNINGVSKGEIQLPITQLSGETILAFTDVQTTMNDILGSIGETYALNSFIAQASSLLLYSQEVSKDSLNQLIQQNFQNFQNSPSYYEVSILLSQLGNTITMKDMANVIRALYTPFKDAEQQGNFSPYVNTVTVKSFVGTAVLQLVSSVVSMIGIVISSISRILGILLTIFGAIISWLLQAGGVTTAASIDVDCGNFYTNTPIFAFVAPASLYPKLSELLQVGGSGLRLSNLGMSAYIWKLLENDAEYLYFNTYIDLNVHPMRLWNDIDGYDGWDEVIKLAPKPEGNYTLDKCNCKLDLTKMPNAISLVDWDSCAMNYVDWINFGDNDDFKRASVATAIFFATIGCVSRNLNYITPISDLWLNADNNDYSWLVNSVLYLRDMSQNFDGSSFTLPDEFVSWSALANICSSIISKAYTNEELINTQTKYFYRIPETGLTSAIAIVPKFYALSLEDNIKSDGLGDQKYWYTGCWNIQSVEMNPKRVFLTFPNYSNGAVMNTLAVIGAIVGVGLAATFTVKSILKRTTFNWANSKMTQLQDLRSKAESSGAADDWKRYYKASKWFNVKAKILGLGSYDAYNAWMTQSDDSSGSVLANQIFTSQDDNYNKLRNLIVPPTVSPSV